MTQDMIFGPFFIMMLLTLVVWLYVYIRRISFITGQKLNIQDMTPSQLAKISPPAVSRPSDNLKNLFEIPVIFYAVVLYLFLTQQVDTVYVVAAWIFVGFRILHSLVHCTFNLILLRFWLYVGATVVLWLMVLRATLTHFL